MKLYNTLGRKLENFKPVNGIVKIYTCGPTVYNFQHIGNYAAQIYWDLLVRTLKANGYAVKRVLNLTDVGHLVSDSDEGEDKLEKGAKREGKSVYDIAKFYSDDFLRNFYDLELIDKMQTSAVLLASMISAIVFPWIFKAIAAVIMPDEDIR